ncbi:MAG: IS607 family transposase [Candidatus Hodarchaeales archaeon]|jgi:putative resolvase
MATSLEKHYRIGQAAEVLGLSIPNLRLYLQNGTIQAVRTPGGHWRIPERELLRLTGQPSRGIEGVVIYARVSSQKQKQAGNLDRQVERLQQFAENQQLTVIKTITDVGSGINDKRKGLKKLFRLAHDQRMTTVLIEFRDRLTRFGYRYVTDYLAAYGVEVIVTTPLTAQNANDQALNQELVDDLIAIIYSFSGKLYGRCSAHFRKLRRCVKKVLTSDAENTDPISKGVS